MRRWILLGSCVVGFAVLALSGLELGKLALAGPEEDCANGPYNVVMWIGPDQYTRTTTASNGAFSINDEIVWCYHEDPDFGCFEAQYDSSENIKTDPEVTYSPLYYYPTTHYGTLEVAISGELDDHGKDGQLVSRVKQVWPYSYDDMTLYVYH